MEQYTEKQILGYLIITLKEFEKSDEEIESMIERMAENMETWVEQHAENVYWDF